jgi:hypothetical protein
MTKPYERGDWTYDTIEAGMEEARAWIEATGDREAGRATADQWLVRLVELLALNAPVRIRRKAHRILETYNSF